MKKILFMLLIAVIGCQPVFGSTNFGRNRHSFSVEDEFGDTIPMADIQSVQILFPGSLTNQTIYQDSFAGTTITQPVTASSSNTTLARSVIWWWGSNAFDALIKLNNGTETRVEGGNASTGAVIIQTPITTHTRTVVNFNAQPLVVQEDGTAASGVDTEVNVMNTGDTIFEYSNINTQTILVPNIVATGLDIAKDLTDTDGLEITEGILASSKSAYVIGTAPAFFARLRFTITDVSGTDDCAFGFRLSEAYQATVDGYNDMAALNVISGDINIETILNGGGTTTTDTTSNWADLATHTLQINVSAAGVVTYLIDGIAPATTAAFTFDDADVVLPFFYFIHDANIAESTILLDWEVGLQ